MELVIGNAKVDEAGKYSGGAPGDQLQRNGAESSKQEVGMQPFYVHKKGWAVMRPSSPTLAAAMAQKMITACNNDHIGYSQSQREGVIQNGVASQVDTNCDCSSLVRACYQEASGKQCAAFDTSGLISALAATGDFLQHFLYTSNTELFNGDVLVTRTKGHAAIVVSGNPRSGTTNDNPTGTNLSVVVNGVNTEALLDSSFVERKKAPTTSDSYYMPTTRQGGQSPFNTLDQSGNLVLTNTSYAWCRFSEVLGAQCKLSRGAGGSWYGHKEDKYKRSVAPALGDVMCFSHPTNGGYVCIVEEIVQNEMIVTSQVRNSDHKWYTSKRIKNYGSWDTGNYTFQGFIHNPKVNMAVIVESALESFLRIAEEAVGNKSKDWITFVLGQSIGNNSTYAPFIVGCSKAAGSSLNIVIPNTFSCSAIARIGSIRNMGKFVESTANGKTAATPKAGDIILFRNSSTKRSVIYSADKAGIVTEINKETTKASSKNKSKVTNFAVVIAYKDKIKKETYTVSDKSIVGYYRPNWKQVDGTSESIQEYRNAEGLYAEGTTIEDAAARSVCYLSTTTYQPSISPSGIELAAINYTGLLSNMYSVFSDADVSDTVDANLIVDFQNNSVESYFQFNNGAFNSASSNIASDSESTANALTATVEVNANANSFSVIRPDTNKAETITISENAKTVFGLLKNAGYNNAGACGILGNIQRESQFNPGAVNSSGYSGLCQWGGTRKTSMIAYVGSGWQTNVNKQVEFMLSELNSKSFAQCSSLIKNIPDTVEGTKQAADYFVRKYEIPGGIDMESAIRKAYAEGFYGTLR